MAELELDDATKALLKQIVDHFDDEDRAVRDRQIRQWRRLKLLWENIQHVYYSEVAHDWRIPESERGGEDTDQGYYDKPVNIFRAYLESIIAALSVTVPSVTCYPDDADNPLDVTTAKAGDKIGELLFRHNDMPLFWLHALFIFCTEGMTACYTYPKESEEYGTYDKNQYDQVDEHHALEICPFCQTEMVDEEITDNQSDKFMPGQEDVNVDYAMDAADLKVCPNCAQAVIPDKRNKTVTVTRLIGVTKHPKSRICMEVYGGLFVKVPVWARNQKECSYLIYSYETHFSNVIEKYPELRDKVVKQGSANYDLYEQWGRTSPQYHGEHPINNVTVRNCWLRPCSYNVLNADEVEDLKKQFPDGVKVIIVNDTVAYACNEALDDCWTITHNPLSDYIHFDPIGLLLTSVQDITNDLVSLTLQTIEHGIPQTFADPKVLNFNSYRQSEVIPGGIYPATPKSGRPLSEGFYEVRTATLSQEVLPFSDKIQQTGQLVSGALPSLFGGQMAGSRTASEYSMSRAQALQRLQTTWKMLLYWWKEVFAKAIPMYIKEMKEDEKQVKKDNFGNFVNIMIRRSELEGKIGNVEIEANENLPITWNQQKDTIMELFKMNNEALTALLMGPENLPFVKRAIGFDDFIIPDDADKQKEYEEIEQLVNSEPIQQPPDPMMEQQAMMAGQPPPPPVNVPSVPADYDVDNHAIAADIDRRWLISDAGRLCKLENPAGYENVLLHMKMHKEMDMGKQMEEMQKQMMAQQGMMPPPPAGPPPPDAGQTPQSTGEQLGDGQNEPYVQ
jgi:hypothetical protein